MMKRCAHFINRNLLEHQHLHYGPILLSSAAVIHNSHSNDHTTTSLQQPSFRDSPHKTTTIRNLTTDSITAAEATKSKQQQQQRQENNDPSLPIIQGTIPLHGKGLKIGHYAQIHRKFTQEDVNLFGTLSGDHNPVHFPPQPLPIPKSTSTTTNPQQSSSPIIHGILLSSLFSTIFGTLIPGAIYRHQSLKFQHVVHVNEEVVGRVVVTKLRQVQRRGVLCTCDTSVVKVKMRNNNDNNHHRDGSEEEEEEIVCISGDAQVWLPDLQLVDEV